jgi:exopolysaccharide production protein ExoZ
MMSELDTRAGDYRLWSLQAGRAIASILLVLYHTSCCVFGAPKYWSYNPVGILFSFGAATSFCYFFALSGFTIMHKHAHDLGKPARVFSYAKRRIVRVYPAYWVMLLCLLIAYFMVPELGQGFEREPKTIVSSLSLVAYGPMRDLQRPQTIMLGAWTLYHGILFYVFFGIMILSVRVGTALMLLWLLASALMLYNLNDVTLMSFYFAPIHLLFGMGMGAALILRKDAVVFPRALALLGGILVCVSALEFGALSDMRGVLLGGAGSTVLILGLAAMERRAMESRMHLHVPLALKVLGDASYAIFLAHFPVLILLAKLVSRLTWREIVPVGVWYLGFSVTAICAGILFHVVIEQPIVNRIRGGRAITVTGI